MSIYQRLDYFNQELIKNRAKLVDGLIKTPQNDYVGYRITQTQILQLDDILARLKSILQEN